MSTYGIILSVVFLVSQSHGRQGAEPPVDLRIGDLAPLFVATDDNGKSWKLADHLGERVIVLYFYPADFTSGCERQADTWRENAQLLSNLGVEVVGISADSVESHQLFKEVRQLDFALLSDQTATVAKLYGVSVRRGGSTGARDRNGEKLLDDEGNQKTIVRAATCCRSTFVIDRNGKIIYAKKKVKAVDRNQDVLTFLRKTLPGAN